MRRFGNVPNLEKKYVRRPGVYAILTRGDQILLTYQEEPDFEFQLPGGGVDKEKIPSRLCTVRSWRRRDG